MALITDPSNWTREELDNWFDKGEWLKGWNVKPDESINSREFAFSYFKNTERWDKTFSFLNENDLAKLDVKKHILDGDNLIVAVSEYTTRNEEDARFEAHLNYIDLQYVVSGKEIISVTPLSMQKDIVKPYDHVKDVVFMTVKQAKDIKASPEKFFLFFPDDIHRPMLKDGENTRVRKVVVKIKID